MLNFLLSYGCSLLTAVSLGADKISINESLSGSRTLVSAGDQFEFGFSDQVILSITT